MENDISNYLADLDYLEERERDAAPGIERYIARLELFRKLKEDVWVNLQYT